MRSQIHIKRLWVYFVVFVVLFIGGCTEFNPVTQQQEIILYSSDREVNIGKNVARQVEKEYELVINPLVVERIDKIARKIIAVAERRDIEFYVRTIKAKEEEKEDGADINAFSLPGGYVYLYDGLVDFADNDDQLACVIAHEIGHIVAKHGIKRLQAQMGYTLLALASMGVGDAELARGVNAAFVSALVAYSQEDEFLADKLGIRYAQRAGYNPRAMIEFLQKLKDKQRKDPLRAKSIFRTHPYFSEREVAIKKQLGEPLSITDYVNIAND